MSGCKTCDKPLGRRNTSGHCIPCGNRARWSDPAFRERQVAGIRHKHSTDPAFVAALRERARAHGSNKDTLEQRSLRFKRDRIWILGNASQGAGSEARRKASRAISETRMAWCPPELREAYRFLTLSKAFRAAEARTMIEEHHAIAMERWRRSIGIMPDPVEPETDDAPPVVDPTLPIAERAMTVAAWRLGTTIDAVRSRARTKPEVQSRWAVMVRLRGEGVSYPKIARLLGISDHGSIIYGVRQAADLAKRDPVFAEALELARAA